MTTEYTVKVKRFQPTDPRLGRHVRHDSRSLAYQVQPKPRHQLNSIRHISKIPVLDQGSLGSCTGNAATKALSYGKFWDGVVSSSVGFAAVALFGKDVLSTTDAAKDEQYAVDLYSDATKLDPWQGEYPPDDTGSDGLSVAKVLQARGLIAGYQHATSLDAVLTALQDGPVITGTVWNQDMFHPDGDGRLHITGAQAGGHEYVLDEVDMQLKRIWIQNSWDRTWGQNGRAYYTFDDYETLLHNQGDATIFVPNSQPAPTPTPTPPTPVVDNLDRDLYNYLSSFFSTSHYFYKPLQKALRSWMQGKAQVQ